MDNKLWGIIHDEPHPHMSAAVFWGTLGAAAVGWGNGYAWIRRDKAARVINLVPLKPGLTSPVRTRNGELLYATTQTDTGAVAYIDPENILHIPGLTFDGYVGISPIQECKNAFGLSMAAEKFGAQFFGNGARATGVLSHPGQLEDEAYENLKKSVREWATGESALRPIILEEGMKWEQVTVAPNDAQFIATRQFQRSEIAALYRVAMHLLQDLQRATNNNIEHQSLDHVRYCLRPWAVRIEQEVNRKLLPAGYVMEHNFKDMQRGDFASQAAGIQILRNIGYYSNNDIARALRENPTPASEGGDIRIIQGAMIPLTALLDAGDENANTTESDAGQTNPFDRILPAYQRLFRDAVGRVINRKGEPVFARQAFRPVISSLAQAMLASRFGTCDLTKKELGLIESSTADAVVAAASWNRKDAAAVADRLTEQVYGVLAGEILE